MNTSNSPRVRRLVARVLIGAVVLLCLVPGCRASRSGVWVSDMKGSLTREQAGSLLVEAEARSASSGYLPIGGWHCYFDRWPSGFLAILCGRVAIEGDGVGVNPGGDPYYLILYLESDGAGSLKIRDEIYLFSTEDYPHVLFDLNSKGIAP